MPSNQTSLAKWGIEFQNPDILRNVCTHPSLIHSEFEKYEFLGDKILGFIVATQLIHSSQISCEGELSKIHSLWVNKRTLTKLGERVGLAKMIHVRGNIKNETLLSDGFEALIGGIYLDRGLQAVIDFWNLITANVEPVGVSNKTTIQEWAHVRKLEPQYKVECVGGSAHQPQFEARLTIGTFSSIGYGTSKKDAENDAANNFVNTHKSITVPPKYLVQQTAHQDFS